jgi:hypothetical protein
VWRSLRPAAAIVRNTIRAPRFEPKKATSGFEPCMRRFGCLQGGFRSREGMNGANPSRDALALGLAWLDEDMQRVADLRAPYRLGEHELYLVAALLEASRLQRDPDEPAELLYGMALAAAR